MIEAKLTAKSNPTTGMLNPDQDRAPNPSVSVNEELKFHVWPSDICMATNLIPYKPLSHPSTKKMYNFVSIPTFKKYEF